MPSASGRPKPSIAARRSASIVSCGKAGDSLGQLQSAFEVLARLGQLVDQADAVGLLGLDRAAGEDQLQRPAHANHAGEALGAAVDEGHAPAALEESEGRLRGGDPHVAPERQLHPTRQAPAVDRGDRRLGGSQARRPHRAVGVVDVEVHRFQVGTGAERLAADAGEDEDASAVVGLELLQPLAKGLRRGRVDRVAPLRPVDRHHRGRADRS